MDHKQATATAAVMHHLGLAERARDASLRANAELMITMIDARAQAKLHFGDGQPALEHFGRAMAAGIEERRHMVLGHARLARLAGEKHFDFSAMGDADKTNWDDVLLQLSSEEQSQPA